MNCPVVIQTCDKYERYWDGLFRYMKKNWDFEIDSPIYFCNEESKIELPRGFKHMPTGKGSFVENLLFILENLHQDQIFYMLEDFWPTSPMTSAIFGRLHKIFEREDLDALQVSSYLPYYSLGATDTPNLFRFARDSEWIFNFQARFWKTESLAKFLTEPEVPESSVGSAITVEIASDNAARSSGGLDALLYHYFWYPISGVSYRGELTEIGMQMQNVLEIDKMVEEIFNRRASSPSVLP